MTREGQTIASEYVDARRKMETLHVGRQLEDAAREVVRKLPAGQVWLVSTSLEGAAIAAACSVLAVDRRISWDLVNITRPLTQPPDSAVVVVEAVDPGDGWRRLVLERFPKATVVIPAGTAA